MSTGSGPRAARRSRTSPPLAGVSLGTVSNVLNRPDRVSAATRERVEQAMAELGFVRNESARQLRAGHEPHARLRDARRRATRSSPTSPRASRTPPRPPTSRCSSATATTAPTRERAYLDQLAAAAGPGHPDHPGRPRRRRGSTTLAERGTPARDRRPHPPRRHALLRRRRRRPRRPARGRAPHRPRPPPDRLRRRPAARSARSATGYAGRPAAWAAAGLPAEALADVSHRRRSPSPRAATPGERLAGLPASTPARPPRSAPTTCSPSACSSSAHRQRRRRARRPRHRRLRRHRVRRCRRGPAHLGAPAPPRAGAGRCRLVLDEADNADHRHQHVVFTPELVARASTRHR